MAPGREIRLKWRISLENGDRATKLTPELPFWTVKSVKYGFHAAQHVDRENRPKRDFRSKFTVQAKISRPDCQFKPLIS